MENEKLYRRAQAREADAFERLHKQLANFIRAIALEACRHFECTDVVSTPLPEDLCAEGSLELWERILRGGYDECAGKLTTYLYPFLRGSMYRCNLHRRRYREHTARITAMRNIATHAEPVRSEGDLHGNALFVWRGSDGLGDRSTGLYGCGERAGGAVEGVPCRLLFDSYRKNPQRYCSAMPPAVFHSWNENCRYHAHQN